MKKKLLIGGISTLVVIIIAIVCVIVFVVNRGDNYIITYETNGGYIETLEKEVEYGKKFHLDKPTHANASFLGWYTSLENDGVAITDKAGNSLGKYKTSSNSTVYAKWEYWDTEGLNFELLTDGSGYGVSASNATVGEVVRIPNEYNGKPVVRINSYAFRAYKNLKRIIMPDTVTTIGVSAFEDCIELEFIDVSENLSYIEANAFSSCSKLLSFDFNENILYIGKNAFSGAMLGKVDLSTAKEEIVLDEYCFSGCIALSDFISSKKLEKIPEYAFYGCTALKTIELGGAIRKVDNRAFANCSSLRTISLGKNVSVIGFYAFDKCTSLSEILVDSENNFFMSEENVLFNKDKTVLIRYAPLKEGTGYTVPNTVKEIDYGAFDSSNYLKDISMGRNVETIKANAFSSMIEIKSLTVPFIGENYEFNTYFAYWFGGGYTSINTNIPYTLKTVVILDGLEVIGEYAFQFCNTLTTISLPDTIRNINKYAFYGCSNLKTLRLPSLLEKIGENVFLACTRLQSVSIDGSNSYYKTSEGVLYNGSMTELILYPASKVDETFTVNAKIERISDYAFYYASSLKTVIFNEGVKDIGVGAFAYCRKLNDITLTSTIETISEFAFNNCTSLTNIILPEDLSFIGKQAFYACSRLEEVVVNMTEPIEIDELVFLDTSEDLKILFDNQEIRDTFAKDEFWFQYSQYFQLKETVN